MKPRARKLLAVFLPCMMAGLGCLRVLGSDEPAASPSASDTPGSPSATVAPAKTKGSGKKLKASADPNATPRAPKVKKVKEIPFPLSKGSGAGQLVIPQNDIKGQLLSQIMAVKATRISNELVRMEEMKMDLYHPDGKEDFHIYLPASVFNLQTHIISSEAQVRVSTSDFELTGDKMEFNTEDRTGQLVGHVRMVIRNLKQVAGPQSPPTP